MPSAVAPAAAAAAAAEDPPPLKKKGGKKKLLLMLVVVLVLLAVAAAAAVVVIKKRQAAALEDGLAEDAAVLEEVAEIDETPPVFLPLDPFTFNLADKTVERYAQIGITLELDSPEAADRLKAYMPAVRGNILMLLAHKTADDLLDRAGKERLAAEIMREAVRPMGIKLPPVETAAEAARGASAAGGSQRSPTPPPASPVRRVHFSNFIIQ